MMAIKISAVRSAGRCIYWAGVTTKVNLFDSPALLRMKTGYDPGVLNSSLGTVAVTKHAPSFAFSVARGFEAKTMTVLSSASLQRIPSAALPSGWTLKGVPAGVVAGERFITTGGPEGTFLISAPDPTGSLLQPTAASNSNSVMKCHSLDIDFILRWRARFPGEIWPQT
jgi:hypothetical protein